MKQSAFFGRMGLAVALAFVAALPAGAEAPLNIIYFGNSHTVPTTTNAPRIPEIVADIAVAAGHLSPSSRNLASNGKSLQWHLDNNTAGIVSSPRNPKTWDFVVLQDRAAGPTRVEGNLAQHLSASLGLYQAVADSSPNVVPVMYETWARAAGSNYYPQHFTGPEEYQAEVRNAYDMSAANIDSFVGTDLARVAPVGDAYEAAGFDVSLYRGSSDNFNHASNLGKLLGSLVIYSTIYEDKTLSDIDLTGIRADLGFSSSAFDGSIAMVVGAAESVQPVPEPASLLVVGLGGVLIVARRPRKTLAS